LTFKNEEALLITSMLKENDIPATLLADKEGFSLGNLLEIESFTFYLQNVEQNDFGLVSPEEWENCKSKTLNKYSNSGNLNLIERIWNEFEQGNPRKFVSVWKSFLKESQVQDFIMQI